MKDEQQIQERKCTCCGAIILSLGDISLGDLCDKCNGNVARQEFYKTAKEVQAMDHPKILNHINNIENPELISKPVTVEAVISSASISYVVPSKIKATIQEKDQETVIVTPLIEIDDPINVSLIAVTEETKNSRITKFFKTLYPNAKAADREELNHRTVYMLRVRPPVFTLEKCGDKIVDEGGYEYKHLDLYVASDKQLTFQPSTLIRLTGLPLANPRTQKTTMLAYVVEFPEDNASFDENKLNGLKAAFEGKSVIERLTWILNNFELYSHIFGRNNITEAGLLSYFSPILLQFNGELQRGWSISAILGDTTTGKSETIKKLSKLLRAGSVISAETASTVGLTGTTFQMENGTWLIDWGFLPLMDRKLLAIDGSHKLSSSCWAALAEAERSGILSIAKAAKNTTNARTRQIRIYNAVDLEQDRYTTKSLANFLYRCQALETVLDKTSMARLDLCVFSDQRDVNPEIINTKTTKKPDPALENLAEVLKWAWGNTAKVEWTETAENLLLEQSTQLYNKFFYEAIPLVSIDVKWKIARLSVALAYCTLSANEDYSVVQVTEEHVRAIVDFITDEYTEAGLGILAQEHKIEKLTIDDVADLILKVERQLFKNPVENLPQILQFIVTQNHITFGELKQKFSLSDNNQARPLMAILKTEGLLSSKRGYYPTPKLIEAYKITKGFTVLSDLSELSGLEKKTLPQTFSDVDCKQPLTLKGSFSEDDKTDNPDKKQELEIIGYAQKVYRLLVSLSLKPGKCMSCESFASERQVQKFVNDSLESISYYCGSCLKRITQAYEAQGAIIEIEMPTPPEGAYQQ